jgi:putative membrane protein
MGVKSSALGALLALSGTPWYAAYTQTAAAWGLTPLEDQQLAGLIMWIPGGGVYLVVMLALLAAWLCTAERRAGRARPVRSAAASGAHSAPLPRSAERSV